MRSYKPEELFDEQGAADPRVEGPGSQGPPPHERKPGRQWRSVAQAARSCPISANSAVEVEKPGATLAGNVPTLGNFLREVMRQNMQNFRVFGPDETQSNRLEALYEVTKKVWLAEYFPEDADGGESRARTAASWRCSASTPWKGGWRATF